MWLRCRLATTLTLVLALSVAMTASAQTAAVTPLPLPAETSDPAAGVHRGDEVRVLLKTPAGRQLHGNVVALDADTLTLEWKTRLFPHYVPHRIARAEIASIAVVPAVQRKSHDGWYIAPLVIGGIVVLAVAITVIVIVLVKRPTSALAT